MLIGRFVGPAQWPLMRARLLIPASAIQAPIEFLINTGADRSILMPDDVAELGLLPTPGPAVTGVGLGGAFQGSVQPCRLAFSDSKGPILVYALNVLVAGNDPNLAGVPSILGRDILNRWRIVYDPLEGALEAEARSADLTFA